MDDLLCFGDRRLAILVRNVQNRFYRSLFVSFILTEKVSEYQLFPPLQVLSNGI